MSYNLGMRALAMSSFLFSGVLGIALGCGAREGGSEPSSNAGSSSAGSRAGGSGASGGPGAGSTTGGQPDAQAGGANVSGGDGGLVDCDPKKILCKRLAPTCEAGQVPSVSGSCYGECVKVERCGCSVAADCPVPDEYTCWSHKHCGPFVR